MTKQEKKDVVEIVGVIAAGLLFLALVFGTTHIVTLRANAKAEGDKAIRIIDRVEEVFIDAKENDNE